MSYDRRDAAYIQIIRHALDQQAVPDTLASALTPLQEAVDRNPRGFALEGGNLSDVHNAVEQTRQAWRHGLPWGDDQRVEAAGKLSRLRLDARAYASSDAAAEEQALAIFSYTLERPRLYKLLTVWLTSPRGRLAQSSLSEEVRALLPYVKLLHVALERLADVSSDFILDATAPNPANPEHGFCWRGVRHVFPGYPGQPERNGVPTCQTHEPAFHYPQNSRVVWYAFTSTAERKQTTIEFIDKHTTNHGPDDICGPYGPATIFRVQACRGYRIQQLSYFGDEEAEVYQSQLCTFRLPLKSRRPVCAGALPTPHGV